MFGYVDDFTGFKTPVFSHIRKVNPRDLSTDDDSASKTLKRRIIRQGIPFGPPLNLAKPDPVNGNRGLLFISYQAPIRDQFEF
jgi:deferrochelatase/peroxidase EfeB